MVQPQGLTPKAGQDRVEINSRGPWWMCDRLLRGDEFKAAYVPDGSVPPIQVMGKRSEAPRIPGRGSSMSAVPHTAEIHDFVCDEARRLHGASQREHTRRQRPAPTAAHPSLGRSCRFQAGSG